jgi:hypothetical protein
MKRYRVEYVETWQRGPMSPYVHQETPWLHQPVVYPPPRPVAGKGFARYFVEIDGFTFYFASLDELRVCIDTLSVKLLTRQTGILDAYGHWLGTLPGWTRKWKYRQRAVVYLKEALEAFATGRHEKG